MGGGGGVGCRRECNGSYYSGRVGWEGGGQSWGYRGLTLANNCHKATSDGPEVTPGHVIWHEKETGAGTTIHYGDTSFPCNGDGKKTCTRTV